MSPNKPKRVVYYPPSPKVIEDLARKVCQKMNVDGQVQHGFANFMKLIASIEANHKNQQEDEKHGK